MDALLKSRSWMYPFAQKLTPPPHPKTSDAFQAAAYRSHHAVLPIVITDFCPPHH